MIISSGYIFVNYGLVKNMICQNLDF